MIHNISRMHSIPSQENLFPSKYFVSLVYINFSIILSKFDKSEIGL